LIAGGFGGQTTETDGRDCVEDAEVAAMDGGAAGEPAIGADEQAAMAKSSRPPPPTASIFGTVPPLSNDHLLTVTDLVTSRFPGRPDFGKVSPCHRPQWDICVP
jgi:hypothetical protein